MAIGGAVCLGIERLVTGKWFPLIRACIPHHSHDRNVLVVSRNEKARRKFTRIMFEGTGDLGYFTREYTFAPENGAESRFLPINYFVNYGYDENLCPASDDIQNGYHLDIETGERWGFECIVVAVDGDEKRMQSLLYDVTNLLSSVCWTWRSRTSKIIIAICTDKNDVSAEDPIFSEINNHAADLESKYIAQGRGCGQNGSEPFLQGCCVLNSSPLSRSNMAAMIDNVYLGLNL